MGRGYFINQNTTRASARDGDEYDIGCDTRDVSNYHSQSYSTIFTIILDIHTIYLSSPMSSLHKAFTPTWTLLGADISTYLPRHNVCSTLERERIISYQSLQLCFNLRHKDLSIHSSLLSGRQNARAIEYIASPITIAEGKMTECK